VTITQINTRKSLGAWPEGEEKILGQMKQSTNNTCSDGLHLMMQEPAMISAQMRVPVANQSSAKTVYSDLISKE
jgi:hypothetical protein